MYKIDLTVMLVFSSDYYARFWYPLLWRVALIFFSAGLLPNSSRGFWTLKEWSTREFAWNYFKHCSHVTGRSRFGLSNCSFNTVLCCRETLPVQYLNGKPLCMDQYYQILSTCRIPGPKRDTVVHYSGGTTPPSHVTVVHNFQVPCSQMFA